MGLFDAFKKKNCSICGGDIGLLGNRKLEYGNMCKHCAAKLSPWFNERRHSTVDEINEQLAYREANKEAVAAFHVTRSLGEDMKVLLDEDARKFMVTRARKLEEENPDVIDFSQVTGCQLDIEEDRREDMREDKDGNSVSYNPARYYFSYDFNMEIRVNHPYFDVISFKLNNRSVETNPNSSVPLVRKPNVEMCVDYKEYENMGREIKEILTNARQEARDEAKAAAAPKAAIVCPYCGATTIPDASGCCEFCGGAVNG